MFMYFFVSNGLPMGPYTEEEMEKRIKMYKYRQSKYGYTFTVYKAATIAIG